MLTPETAAQFLRDNAVIGRGDATVREMSGGVSSTVLDIESGGHSWVVKQALPQLRVEREWVADQERALTEARALTLAAGWTPGHVPGVIFVDPELFAIVIERAPVGMSTWKDSLLDGRCDTTVASRLGTLLARWHRLSSVDETALASVDNPGAFEQLRISPYYRATAEAVPEAAESINVLIELMASRRRCLVHGDFSPKNILVGGGQVWVLDFEVAHRGDPDFDVAFLLSHLIAKAFHLPDATPALEACASAFLAAYADEVRGSELENGLLAASGHTGALLMARVHGKSPLEYLDAAGRVRVAAAGLSLLANPFRPTEDAWRTAMVGGGA